MCKTYQSFRFLAQCAGEKGGRDQVVILLLISLALGLVPDRNWCLDPDCDFRAFPGLDCCSCDQACISRTQTTLFTAAQQFFKFLQFNKCWDSRPFLHCFDFKILQTKGVSVFNYIHLFFTPGLTTPEIYLPLLVIPFCSCLCLLPRY